MAWGNFMLYTAKLGVANVQDFQDSGVTFDFGPHLRMLYSSIWERGEGVGHCHLSTYGADLEVHTTYKLLKSN